ncbi:MAG: hypothetical protein ACYCZ7_00245 [Minisyncoccota bacterium]
MKNNETEKQQWEAYCNLEIKNATPILQEHGFSLEANQPHIKGERYLTRPIGGAKKILLLGKNHAGVRVVIKIGSGKQGVKEIEHERICRDTLDKMDFAHNVLLSPKELLYIKKNGRAIIISEFIEQEMSFTERPIPKQFSLALSLLKAQEQAHATTHGHTRIVRRTFGEMHAKDYLKRCASYITETTALQTNNQQLKETLEKSFRLLEENKNTIEQYSGFLANWDLTPQNIRINKDRVYFLDHASFHFGNKHESWARFINFMSLYEPKVAQALVQYIQDNRTPEEPLSLKLMRIYRLVELIRFYAGWLPRTEGSTHTLASARIDFWHEVLNATLKDEFVPSEIVEKYKETRDALRSEEEKQRQIGLH